MTQQMLGQSAEWFHTTLSRIAACDEALQWATDRPAYTLEQAWKTCPVGGWMLYWLSWFSNPEGTNRAYYIKVCVDIEKLFGFSAFTLLVGNNPAANVHQAAVADFLRQVITPEGRPVKRPLHVRLYDLLTDGQRTYYTQFYLAQATDAPEASVRRAIQTLRKAHNISFSDGYGGGYRLLQEA